MTVKELKEFIGKLDSRFDSWELDVSTDISDIEDEDSNYHVVNIKEIRLEPQCEMLHFTAYK